MTGPRQPGPGAAARAGIAYFAIVFAAGFVLGTVRTLLLAPRLGEFAAVLVEIPFMLLVALVACRWLVRRFAVASRAADRLVMGGIGFVLLMAAELLLTLAFGRSPAAFLAGLAEPAGVGAGRVRPAAARRRPRRDGAVAASTLPPSCSRGSRRRSPSRSG